MIAQAHSGSVVGVAGYPVNVEVDLSRGMMVFSLVGLAGAALSEAKTRVRTALENSGYRMPSKRITVNLAPGDMPKDGTGLDLPIALGILEAAGIIPRGVIDDALVVGELGLAGDVRYVKGILPLVAMAKRQGLRRVITGHQNSIEASLIDGVSILGAGCLAEVVEALTGGQPLPLCTAQLGCDPRPCYPDLADVRGQASAIRAMTIAAAGRHNIILIGPPGSGKTMLARRLPSIAPPLSREEGLDVALIRSAVGHPIHNGSPATRPFRAPHHTASEAALVGGGSRPQAGEVTLAHHGYLYLDELPEFRRSTLECLRGPLEEGRVFISRANGRVSFPADTCLVASMNPCPCGYYGHPRLPCTCREDKRKQYLAKLSGPLLDRVDLHVWVDPVGPRLLETQPNQVTSGLVRAEVLSAARVQSSRPGQCATPNGRLPVSAMEHLCALRPQGRAMMARALESYSLSARSYHRILKVARTIADLAGASEIESLHLSEALQYRTPFEKAAQLSC